MNHLCSNSLGTCLCEKTPSQSVTPSRQLLKEVCPTCPFHKSLLRIKEQHSTHSFPLLFSEAFCHLTKYIHIDLAGTSIQENAGVMSTCSSVTQRDMFLA